MFKYYRKMLVFWVNVFFATFFAKKQTSTEKNIAIIFDEAIGDYILFRNFIKIIKESEKYKSHKLTFICNTTCKNLVEFLDSKYIDHLIWVDISKFKSNFIYRYKTLICLSKLTFTEVVIPNESRNILTTDLLALALQAKQKISFIACNRNIGYQRWDQKQKEIANKWYTKLYEVDYSKSNFAFDIRKRLVETLIEEPISLSKPQIDLQNSSQKSIIEKTDNYIILAIGASDPKRMWSAGNWIYLIKFILNNYSLHIVIIGSRKENSLAEQILAGITIEEQKRVSNTCGQTSLVDSLYLIKNTKALIGNDSSAIHIAAALETKEKAIEKYVIFPGKCFTRFVPYPDHITNHYHTIVHQNLNKQIEDGTLTFDYFLNISDIYPINEITPEKIIKKLTNSLYIN